MRFLIGTHAYNSQIQNTALALYEANMLGAAYLGLVDNYRGSGANQLRDIVARSLPRIDRQLKRRRVRGLPDSMIFKHWHWELLRTVGVKSGLNEIAADKLWEWGEYALDRRCARVLESDTLDAYLGVEHGALFSIRRARELGKKSVVAFVSPHRAFRQRSVDSEYEKWPELLSDSAQKLRVLSPVRDARRDDEAHLADAVFANSRLTRNSLLEAGISPQKIITVPLGCPEPAHTISLPNALLKPLKFIYAGSLSVHKGTHYLLKSWEPFRNSRVAELHLYGVNRLPEDLMKSIPTNVICHGSVPADELFEAFQRAAALIFPTLCDGFGLVVTEALAYGLPVISSRNAGAADCIQEGDNGFLVPAGDSESLSERIEWCVSHPDELLAMRENALKSAQQWTWAHFRRSFRKELAEKLGSPAQN